MRGCKCAMSTKALRKSLPSCSSSAVLCCAVRAGQVSMRQKMITTTMAISSATSVKATGHEIRPEFRDFDIERWTLNVGRLFAQALIEHEHPPSSIYGAAGEHEQEQEERERISLKKLPPPTPDRREGRLFPPEQS